jgi:hypothetical protein
MLSDLIIIFKVVFNLNLKLDEDRNEPTVDISNKQNNIKLSRSEKLFQRFKHNSKQIFCRPKWNNFKGVFYKDAILIKRSIGHLIFQFFLPVLQIALFCLCIGNDPFDLPFGIVNNETINNSTYSSGSDFVNLLDDKTFDKVRLD